MSGCVQATKMEAKCPVPLSGDLSEPCAISTFAIAEAHAEHVNNLQWIDCGVRDGNVVILFFLQSLVGNS